MKIENLNNWFTLIANIGVLLGLIFLIIEIAQSNRIALSTGEASLRSEFIDLNAYLFENPGLADSIQDLGSNPDGVTPSQVSQIRAYVRAVSTFYQSVQSAYDNQTISEFSFQSYLNISTQTITQRPQLAPYFVQTFEARGDVETNRMTEHMLEAARLR